MIRIFILWKRSLSFPCMTQPDIFLYGKIPGGFDRQPDFLDGEVREIKDKAGEEDWYYYTIFFQTGRR